MVASSSAGQSLHPNFPEITSADLGGKSISLPSQMPAERTIVLIAFKREQQADIDGWVAGLQLDQRKLPWLEIPVINNPGPIGRWFIDNGMRRGIKDHETWKHVVTLYTKKQEFMRATGISSEDKVYAMVVTRLGDILASTSGTFSADKRSKLDEALVTRDTK